MTVHSGEPRMLVRAQYLKPRPWPNGLGITRDVARREQPDGQMLWLLSIADLNGSAAFSHFPGCDRCFTIIEGNAATLTIDAAPPMLCLPFRPAYFPGDRPTLCTMPPTPARAFNLFFDRSRLLAGVSVHTIAATHRLRVGRDTVAVFSALGPITCDDVVLEEGDTYFGSGAMMLQTGAVDATVIAVHLTTL